MHQQIFSHYVTRSLTKPWEQANRKLLFYDFDSASFVSHPSSTLLVVQGLLTKSQEDYFSKHAEQPLGKLKEKFLDSKKIENSKIYHSPFIYFMLQLERIRRVKTPEENEVNVFNKNIFDLTISELEQCAHTMQLKYKLVALNTLENDYLFYPELGYFTFPIFNFEESFAIHKAIAIPIKLNLALCLIPRSASEKMIQSSRKSLSLFSVGLNEILCKKILKIGRASCRERV